LDSRGLIERAKGALMERERLDDQEAFTHLRRAARSSGRKLSEVAAEVAAGQALPKGRTRPARAKPVNRPGFTGGSGVPSVSRSRVAGPHATVDTVSNSIGVSMPRLLWRRCRLWKISRYSKIALASSTRVRQRRWSRSSTCIRDQNASIIELS
jgi:hypothetical protein